MNKFLTYLSVGIGAIVGVLMCIYLLFHIFKTICTNKTLIDIDRAQKKFNRLNSLHKDKFNLVVHGRRYVAFQYYKKGWLTKKEHSLLIKYWLGDYDNIIK